MIRSIQTKIGPKYNQAGTLQTPSGVDVPRPFDIRNNWKPPTGRSTGGYQTLANFDSMDWLYGATSDGNYLALLAAYNPVDPRVWVYVYDPETNDGAWWSAVMLEPHVERSAGSTISSVIVSFRHMQRAP